MNTANSGNDSNMPAQRVSIPIMSFWQIFRLALVLTSLYIVCEVFYRRDGFTYYYASFPEFLPALALAVLFWSTAAFFLAMFIWLTGAALTWFCMRVGWKIKPEFYLIFASVFITLGVAVWIFKQYLMLHGATIQVKTMVFLTVSLISLFLTWHSRNSSERWIRIIHERITPLVWLFGIFIIFSMMIVAYHAL